MAKNKGNIFFGIVLAGGIFVFAFGLSFMFILSGMSSDPNYRSPYTNPLVVILPEVMALILCICLIRKYKNKKEDFATGILAITILAGLICLILFLAWIIPYSLEYFSKVGVPKVPQCVILNYRNGSVIQSCT